MSSLWEVLILGLVLGVRHAFDADHLVAVTTIVSGYRNPLRAIWIGVSWGLGHTTTLLLAGATLLLLGIRIPENLALVFEFLVGIMLILLGVQTFWGFRRRKIHMHPHDHDPGEVDAHRHFHSHESNSGHAHHNPQRRGNLGEFLVEGITPGEYVSEGARKAVKPFFRVKSYAVGTVHGLAGSAALMLLVLASIRSTWNGVMYIVVFGMGTVVSMGIISIFISLPFSASGRLPRLNQAIQATAGAVSIAFGLVLMYHIGVIEGLFLAH